MDSLIVLRKPLRNTQLEQKFIIPKKSKKAVPQVDPIPPNPNFGEESNEAAISFVKLYKDLCVDNLIRATSMHARSPTRVRMCLPASVHHVNSTRVDLNSAACVDLNSTRVYVSPAPQFECPPGHLYNVNAPESRTKASRSAARVDVNSPARVYVSPALQFECPLGHLHLNTPESRTEALHSDTSLVTQYFGTDVECNRLFTDMPTPSSARAELILELDYDTSSKDSGFC